MTRLKALLLGVLVVLTLLLGCNDWDGMDRSGQAWNTGAYATAEAEGRAP